MKRLILLIFLCLFSACSSPPDKAISLPLGYKILCSVDGKYTTWLPHEKRISVNVFVSEKEAIRFAWHWETLRNVVLPPESSKYTWTECPIKK